MDRPPWAPAHVDLAAPRAARRHLGFPGRTVGSPDGAAAPQPAPDEPGAVRIRPPLPADPGLRD